MLMDIWCKKIHRNNFYNLQVLTTSPVKWIRKASHLVISFWNILLEIKKKKKIVTVGEREGQARESERMGELKQRPGLPCGSVVESLPAYAGDMGPVPDPQSI